MESEIYLEEVALMSGLCAEFWVTVYGSSYESVLLILLKGSRSVPPSSVVLYQELEEKEKQTPAQQVARSVTSPPVSLPVSSTSQLIVSYSQLPVSSTVSYQSVTICSTSQLVSSTSQLPVSSTSQLPVSSTSQLPVSSTSQLVSSTSQLPSVTLPVALQSVSSQSVTSSSTSHLYQSVTVSSTIRLALPVLPVSLYQSSVSQALPVSLIVSSTSQLPVSSTSQLPVSSTSQLLTLSSTSQLLSSTSPVYYQLATSQLNSQLPVSLQSVTQLASLDLALQAKENEDTSKKGLTSKKFGLGKAFTSQRSCVSIAVSLSARTESQMKSTSSTFSRCSYRTCQDDRACLKKIERLSASLNVSDRVLTCLDVSEHDNACQNISEHV
nr:probable GPI-anchored adhesin-like protein PGA55 [Penaeus vannamei]